MNLYQLACSLILTNEMLAASAREISEEAVLRPDGKILGVSSTRRASVMRRQEEDSTSSSASEQQVSFMEVEQSDRTRDEMDRFFKSMARPSLSRTSFVASRAASKSNTTARRKKKTVAGAALGSLDLTERKQSNDPLLEEIQKGGLKQHNAPTFEWPSEWLGMQMEMLQDNCQITVGEDKGYSDYGSLSHSCAMCSRDCNEQNKQQNVEASWTIEPSLKDEPAKAVHFYTKMESVDGLGCTNCLDWQDKNEEEIGVSHNYEIEFTATKESKDVPDFKSMIGTYIGTGSGTEFAGKLFFIVRDTVPPKNINGCKKNPPGRRYALQGASRYGELFYCQRFCTIPAHEGGCPCGFMDAIGCMVHVHVATGMMVKFAVRVVADDAMAPMTGADGKPKSLGGQQWEAVATFGHDDSDSKIEAVIGRVILTGNGEDEGIVSLKQNVHHKGCTPCDMFYSSFLSIGPFITSPANVHWIRSADIIPPKLTEETCELFRVTAKRGHVLLFESGPGIWPVTQAEATLFTCPQPTGNQTR